MVSSASSLPYPWPLCHVFFNDTATTEIYTLSLHDALPISWLKNLTPFLASRPRTQQLPGRDARRSEEHTSELQSHHDLVCRLLLENIHYHEHRFTARARLSTGEITTCGVTSR